MKTELKLMVLFVLVLPPVYTKSKKLMRLQTNALSKTRCDLMCYDVNRENKSQCRSKCRTEEQKPGTCPNSDNPQWAAACVEACNLDSQCDGTQRCCRLGCGAACSEPVDLHTIPGLPALPTVETPRERKRSLQLHWSDGVGDLARAVPGKVLYLLEEQHHLGPSFEADRLGNWNLVLRTNKTKVALRNLVKPGRWYRFRVAAVSAAGTRGFSDPSTPYTLRKGPRPPPVPKKLKVHPIKADNGTIVIRLEWKEPRSDLPIIRYKVFWSRRVRGVGGELDSVFVNHQTVPKEQTYLEIKDLQPNSMYFLQVQSISQFGQGKLRSDKAAIFYNTTSANDPELIQRREKNDKKGVKNLKLHKIVWHNKKLQARISWDPQPKSDGQARRYFVNWKTTKCENIHKENKSFTASTEQNTFEIYELDYHCKYKVTVNKSRKPKSPDAELEVVVPGCDYFQKRVNGTIDCNT